MGVVAAFALVFIVLFLLGILVVLFVVRAKGRPAPLPPQAAQGPAYRHRLESIGYYRPGAELEKAEEATERAKRPATDPRDAPLPRCPTCGAAVAFTDERCPKCCRAQSGP